MDLFASIAEDIETRDGMNELADRVIDFVANLSPAHVNAVNEFLKEREFELWDTAARKTQAFAFEKGLHDEWWALMGKLKLAMKETGYTNAWDAAFDYLAASFVKPWAGTAFPNKYYDLMTKPLIRAGFTE